MTDFARDKVNVIAFYELMFNECWPCERSSGMPALTTSSTTRTWRPVGTASSRTSSAWHVSGRVSGSR